MYKGPYCELAIRITLATVKAVRGSGRDLLLAARAYYDLDGLSTPTANEVGDFRSRYPDSMRNIVIRKEIEEALLEIPVNQIFKR